MTHLMDINSQSIVANVDDGEDTFTEIRKKLLDDFDTVETVRKVLKGSKTEDSREPIKVYLRIRPLNTDEIEAGESKGCIEIENSRTVVLKPPKTSFTFKHQSRNPVTAETVQRFRFSRVFGPETNQENFFEETSLSVVKDFISGQNCLVFSYGITNAGKTYTILGDPQNAGILPRTLKILFNSFKDQNYERANLKPKMFCDVVKLSSIQEEDEESKKKNLLLLNDVPTYHQSISSSELSLQVSIQEQQSQEDIIDVSNLLDATSVDVDDQGPIQFSLWISFAEIYNEYIYDLLEPISMNKETRKRTALRVGDDRKGNPYIKGLTEIHVNNAVEACELLKIGRKNQKIASTKLNQNSSRSHCIFTLKILRVMNTNEPHVARVSRLSFVDLAGSERCTKTQNTGVRLKEAGNINTSIMTLGKCVELLRYNQNHVNNQKNIPFRESKLTRLFQGFFSGKGKASMIVNVNQCASAFDETLHALKFSAIAKKVTTIVHGPAPAVQTHHPPKQQSARSTRSSVAWADGSLSTPLGNKVQIKNDVDETVTEDETLAVISACASQDCKKMIAALQERLIEEVKQKTYIEVKIREEVCQEMAEQLVEIEKNYNERMVEEQRATEELYEKRIDILTKSVKKARKRPRVECIEDDDDEWISSVFLHREEVKNKELSERIAELEAKLEQAKGVEVSSEQQIIEMRAAEQRIVELEKEICSMKEDHAEAIKCLEKELSVREESLKDAKESEGIIAKLEEDIGRMKEQNEKEICDLRKVIEHRDAKILSLEELMAKNEKLLADGIVAKLEEDISRMKEQKEKEVCDLRKAIEDRDKKILSLEEIMAKNEKLLADGIVAKLEENMSRMKEQKEEEISDLRKAIDHRDKKILSLEEIMAKNEKLLAETDTHAEELRKKDSDITALREEINKLASNQGAQCDSLREELKSRDEQLVMLERSLKDCKVELESKTTQLMAVKKVQGARSSTPTKSRQNNLVKQLEKRLEDSKAALDKKNSQLISKNNAVTKLENNLKELKAELRQKERELNKLQDNIKQLTESKVDNKNETINELNIQLREQQNHLLNKTKEKDEVEENLKFVEGELQILSSKEKEILEEMEKLRKERDELKEEVEKRKSEAEKNEEAISNLNELLETQRGHVEELRKTIESKEETLRQFKELHDKLQVTHQELQQNFDEKLKETIEGKEETLRQCKDAHNKEMAELNNANQELQQRFDKALMDLTIVQARVAERNQKLDDMANLDSSLKDAYRSKEAEVVQLRKELNDAQEELRDRTCVREEEVTKMKQDMEKTMMEEILKEKRKCEEDTKRLKTGLEEQEEVLGQMEINLALKEEEITELNSRVEKLLSKSENMKELTKENEDLDEQCERLKIKIFELETEVEKLQQEVKIEAANKDKANQALRDGIEIVKAKKLELETKMSNVEEELRKEFEMEIENLKQEVERLKCVDSAGGVKTNSSDEHSGSNSNSEFEYKPVEVEKLKLPVDPDKISEEISSFNLTVKDRVEIDVTPITGSGLPKVGSKKNSSAKTKSLKRKSSDLTLREIQQICSDKKAKKNNCSEDEFTPDSRTKLRKTRSSVSSRTRKPKTNMTASTFSLTTLDEDSENSNPKAKSGRKLLSKLTFPENLVKSKIDGSADSKGKHKRKLFKKTEISSPLPDSPTPIKSDGRESTKSRAQEIIMRRLRTRDVKVTR